jgi:ankyrin repeat protein
VTDVEDAPVKMVAFLLERGLDIEQEGGACWGWKKFKAAKALALKGANINVQDKRGRTALHIAIEKEFDPALLKWLITHGASPDIPDREGITARLKASRKRNRKFLAALG